MITARHCAAATQVGVERAERVIEPIAVRGAAIVHPDPAVDVALLPTAADLGVPVRPRATAFSAEPASGDARLAGYGNDDATGRAGFGTRRYVDVAASAWTCTAHRAANLGCVPSHEIVVASSQGDTCTGDSGGALLDQVDGRWRLVGITSRPIPGTGIACGRGGIYVHVGPLATWLAAALAAEESQ